MKISRIEIKNFIGIKQLIFSPGKVNKISGDSGTGKSSLIEGLEKIFTNKNRRTEIIRHGEEEAELFVQLDDGLEINRKTRSEKADYLKVKHDSKSVSSTEGFILKLVNGEIFRPIEFMKKEAAEQTKVILNMLQIPWTVDDIKNWFDEVPTVDYDSHILQILKEIESKYYSERESVNREINLLKANIEGIKKDLPPNYDGAIWKEANIETLYKKVTDAEENNKKLDDAEKLIEGLRNRIEDIKVRAANAKESKELDYNRQRDMLNNSIKQLNANIENETSKVDDVDRKVSEEEIRLENELQASIEKLKMQYQVKKQTAKESIRLEAEQSKVYIAEYNHDLSEKGHKLATIKELEKKDLDRIVEYKAQQIELEQTKTGNAQKTIEELQAIPIIPLREEANNTAQMKEYLREWERMNDIIREKLSPKEDRASELTTKILKARTLPKELLKTVALPVEGLEVDEKGMFRVSGTLLDGLSEGESMDFAFSLAKAQAGELKVICIDGWQNLGSKQKKILEDAMIDDYQYFLLETKNNGQDFKIEEL